MRVVACQPQPQPAAMLVHLAARLLAVGGLVVLDPAAVQADPWRTYHSALGPDQQPQLHQVDLGALVRQGDRVSGVARIRRAEGLTTRPSRSYRFTVDCRAQTVQEQLTPGALIYQRRGSTWWSEAERRRGSRGGSDALGGEPAADSSRLRAMDAQFTALWSFVCQPR